MRIKITGSRAHRVWKCPASAVLPQVSSTEIHPMANHGKAVHRFLERVKAVGKDVALAEAPVEVRPLLDCLDLEALPVHLATEVSFAYDWKNRTGRELGRNIGRPYDTPGLLTELGVAELGPTEHGITVDILGGEMRAGVKRGLIADYKTGRTKYPAPDRFGQTLLGAVAARATHGFGEFFLDLIYIDDDGEHYPARRRVDEWDLDTFADEWERANERVDEYERRLETHGIMPNVVEGPHCDYCPAYTSCPAKLALASRLPIVVADLAAQGMTRARAAEGWLVCERIVEMANAIKQQITGMAAFEDIELADGRIIGRHSTTKRKLDAKVAVPVLREKYGDEAVEEATKVTLSMEALRDQVAKRREKTEKISTKNETGVYDRMLQEIDRRGGLEVTTTESIKPYVPSKRLKE